MNKPTILIIDDDRINVRVLYNILKNDYRCLSAVNGEEGIEMARTYIPDIILLDIMMEGMDGYEVCTRIKDDLALGRTSIFFLTSRDAREDIVKGLDMGAIYYITKPVDPEVLQAIIRRFLADKEKSRRTFANMFNKQKIKAVGNMIGQFMHMFSQVFMRVTMSLEMISTDLGTDVKELPENDDEIRRLPKGEYVLISKRNHQRFINSLDKLIQLIQDRSAKMQKIFAVGESIIESGQLSLVSQDLTGILSTIERFDKPEKIIMTTDIQDCGHIRLKQDALMDIVKEICQNSFSSMERGGEMSVRLYREHVMPSRAEYLGVKSGDFAKIEIIDTGTGFFEEYIHRLTEPGFSLEKNMQGRGFGLYEVRTKLDSVGGAIDYESKPNQGTTTYLYVPVFDMSYMNDAEKEGGRLKKKEVAMLVDDSKTFLSLLGGVLESIGYKVIKMQDPRKALEIFQASPKSFDIVVLDQYMPEYSGNSLAKLMRDIRDDIPILIWSSYEPQMNAELKSVVFGEKPQGEKAKTLENTVKILERAKKAVKI